MMKAYADGFPANGKAVPDGAMMAKIEWEKKGDVDSPYAVHGVWIPCHTRVKARDLVFTRYGAR